MLDLRIYRAAFLPAVLVLVMCAFSLANRPRASTATLAPGAFDTLRAFGSGEPPPPDSLRELARSFPDRRPGSPGDEALAGRVAAFLDKRGFAVDRSRREAETIDGKLPLETVVGVRTGLSSRRIVVVAHRDAAEPGSVAELSATAALLELARVFRVRCDEDESSERACGRELRRTLVLVSTSGGSGGAGGARNWAQQVGESPVDAVLVLGDLAGEEMRKPWVIGFSNGDGRPPLALQRTVEAAVRREAGSDPGGPRASAQLIRRAFPLSPGEQAELAAAGLPAIGISASGERGPRARAPVVERRMVKFGRATLRAITAIDESGIQPDETVGPAFEDGPDGIVTLKRVLPDWSVRLLAGALLLPLLLATVDGLARVRRRRRPILPWFGWLAAAVLPFVLAWAWVRLVALVALDVPPTPLIVQAAPLEARGWATIATTGVVLILGWLVLRPMALRRLRGHLAGGADAAAAAIAVSLCGVGVFAWLANPFAAILLLPALHLSLLLAAPEARLRGWRAWLILLGALAPFVLVGVYYGRSLGAGPFELAWIVLAASAGGHVGATSALAAAVLAGCVACALALALRRPVHTGGPRTPDEILTRGPLGYAGPGSLGGTDSALRR
jgi:hypothetical protein